jgi:LytS/YehU family sensor histidine kinase
MLERLTRMLRSILGANHGQLVSLADDVRFAEDYVSIERVRFPDRLRVTWDIAPALGAHRVPALLLQPLIENAIRHAIAPHDRPGHIDVRATADGAMLAVTVTDDGPDWDVVPDAPGVGLQNTRERLQALYKGRASFALERRSGRTVATVRLPADA